MLEKLAVTTRTRSREKLFSLLDLAEHTMMELTDATLDRTCQSCPLDCTRAVRLWRANDGRSLRRLPDLLAGWELGGYRVPSWP